MPTSSRFAVAVHLLCGLAFLEKSLGRGATSADLAQSVNTNPVVVRRLLGILSRAGFVEGRGGRSGGYGLACAPAKIRLDAVLAAVEPDGVLALHENPANRACTVSCGIKPVLGGVFADAERALHASLKRTTLADVLRQVEAAD
ncbi:MAG: Rrf2 family transcriptional regulator [Planctomycetes bacterium]|nr:Rrf2 family transcriptional regulator [Planctomycetota bacterium]